MKIPTKIRKQGGSTVGTIPPEIVSIFDLIPGDTMHWDIEGGKVTIEFYKAIRNCTPALRQENAAEDAEIAAE